MHDEFYTAEEAAQFLNLKRPTLYKLARNNKISSVKIGGNILFDKKGIEDYGAITIEPSAKQSGKKIIDYWMIPRSVRKLVTLQTMIKNDFVNGIIGGQWKGTRSNHRKRDRNLQIASIRGTSTQGFVDDNPGGARTDVALLAALGFYSFDNSGNIQLTYQGQEMLKSTNPALIITQQLLQFRYPSPYSTSINMDSSFKIFPYRFLFRLLTSSELKDDGSIVADDGEIRLTQNEIAQFVITQAHHDNDLERVIQLILESRYSGSVFLPSEKHANIANTFINNLEITGLIVRDSNSSLYVKNENIPEVHELLSKAPRQFHYEIGKEFEFQDRLGMNPNKSKYTRTQSSNRSGGETAVQFLLLDFLSNNPMTRESVTNELIRNLAVRAGTSETVAIKVVNTLLRDDPQDIFSRQYLEYSASGRAFAKEFEVLTTKIIMELIGNAKWVGKEGKSPDVTFTLNTSDNADYFNCIIDCKAEKKYSISNDHLNRMTVEDTGYISVYKADCFIYVANDFSKSFDRNLKKIESKCKIPGSGIRAEDLLYILERHRISPFSHMNFKLLFSLGRIITISDINSLFAL